MPPGINVVEELGKPLFDRRGIQPFHDFPEGPDWWNADGYKAILGQLPKLRMNFFGLHTYPEGGVGPEPVVWIGRPEDIVPDGRVKASYPSRHFTTLNGTWGYRPDEDRRLHLRRGGDVRPRRLRRGLHARHEPLAQDAGRPKRAVSPHGVAS